MNIELGLSSGMSQDTACHLQSCACQAHLDLLLHPCQLLYGSKRTLMGSLHIVRLCREKKGLLMIVMLAPGSCTMRPPRWPPMEALLSSPPILSSLVNVVAGVFKATFKNLARKGVWPEVLYPAVGIPSDAALTEASASWQQHLDKDLAEFLQSGPTFLSINRFERTKVLTILRPGNMKAYHSFRASKLVSWHDLPFWHACYWCLRSMVPTQAASTGKQHIPKLVMKWAHAGKSLSYILNLPE